jgi:hypothetical protein
MGLATLEGVYDGDESHVAACLVDGTTGEAFGPLFDDADDIERFLAWLEMRAPVGDPRRYYPTVLTAWVNLFKGYSTIEDVRAASAATGVLDGLRPMLTFGGRQRR